MATFFVAALKSSKVIAQNSGALYPVNGLASIVKTSATLIAAGIACTLAATTMCLAADHLHVLVAQVTRVPTGSGDAADDAPKSEAQKILESGNHYDPTNPDYEALQRPEVALKGLPRDRVGFVDWMRALRDGTINPRATLDGRRPMTTLDLDIVLKNTREMPWVRFPHLAHTQWLDCSNCHPKPFEPRAGANQISMGEIFRGRFCGMCHDHVAFITFFSCDRCHSVPQSKTSPQAVAN